MESIRKEYTARAAGRLTGFQMDTFADDDDRDMVEARRMASRVSAAWPSLQVGTGRDELERPIVIATRAGKVAMEGLPDTFEVVL